MLYNIDVKNNNTKYMFFDTNNINHAYLVVSKNVEYAYQQVIEFVQEILASKDLQNNSVNSVSS